jgi:hypothetical protein
MASLDIGIMNLLFLTEERQACARCLILFFEKDNTEKQKQDFT